jgi:hypothetical protein
MKYILATIICIFSIQLTYSQNITITKIEENRSDTKSSFSNNLKIELKVSGDEIRKYKSIKLAQITKAIDDQGIDLFKKNTFDSKYSAIDIDGLVEVEIQKAARKALSIKNLEGTINLYNPSIENKGEIHISNFPKRANENLLPASYPLKLIYLTKESLTKYKADLQKKTEADIKKLPEATRKLAEIFTGLFDSIGEISESETEITFVMEGVEDKLVDVYFIDEKGEKIERNGYFKSNTLITYPFSKKIEPNWQMVINIETEGSVKKVPFKLTNIILP